MTNILHRKRLKSAAVHATQPKPSRTQHLKKRRFRLVFTGIVLLLVIGFYVENRMNQLPTKQQTASTDNTDEPPKLQKGTPDYTTVTPKGTSIDSIGGWTRVSPPDRNPVFAFVQTLGDSTISVSQQPLPDNLKVDSEQALSALAKDFRANEMVMAGDIPIYIQTENNGAQSVLFIKKDLLILIKSSRTIANDAWIEYITSLE